MADQQQTATPVSDKQKQKVTVSTTVVCPHCGKEHDVKVEVPEADDAPKMSWQD